MEAGQELNAAYIRQGPIAAAIVGVMARPWVVCALSATILIAPAR